MITDPNSNPSASPAAEEFAPAVGYQFGLSRRDFVQHLGAGLLVTATISSVLGQQRRGRDDSQGRPVSSRIHIGSDGMITVLTGKIEMGQGARAELSQAAAEELRVAPAQIRMLMADTSIVPDDGLSAGSRTTPQTLPAVRQAAAAARQMLIQLACGQWKVEPETVQAQDGKITHAPTQRALTYGELAQKGEVETSFKKPIPGNIEVTPVKDWKVLGTSLPRPNRRDLVTGAHQFPSDIRRPGMLYAQVLRAPSYGARLISVDLAPAQAMKDVVVVRDGDFVGAAAPTTMRARRAIDAIAETAKWEFTPHPSSREVFDHLRERVQGGMPKNSFTEELAQAHKTLRQTYKVPYVQHAPMETRTAVAEWNDGKLTVWTGTQSPFGYHSEIARAFRLPREHVRVIVPDFGDGFGGKHTAEAAIEAARLAQAAKRPVSIQWTREEEFTWAYFRPAALIEAEATLDAKGAITSWHFINVNSGGAAVETPYRAGKTRCRTVGSNSPLRQGSYRTLAATANNFARECFMDELALASGMDPLDFRLAHLENTRIRAVLEEAARRFGWRELRTQKRPGTAVGLACGTEKASVVAACVELAVDLEQRTYKIRRVCQVFECGAIVNPKNLEAQVRSCIIMGLGPALREEMVFEKGKLRNASFGKYLVPRFEDVPDMDIHLLNRPDMTSVGGGETPIIVIAPAIANALLHATSRPCNAMPIRFPTSAA